MVDKLCQLLCLRAIDLSVLLGDEAIYEDDAAPDSGKVLRLFGEGYLERPDEFEPAKVGPSTLSVYFGTAVTAWERGGIVKRDDGFHVVINADEAFGPTFPVVVAAIVQKPTEWCFLLSVSEAADLSAPDFKNVALVSAAAHWKSIRPIAPLRR